MVEPLTDREQRVLELLAGGLISGGIARRLGVHPRTVGRITASLQAKLSARTPAEAVSVGYQRGLLGVGPRAGYRLALVPFREASSGRPVPHLHHAHQHHAH